MRLVILLVALAVFSSCDSSKPSALPTSITIIGSRGNADGQLITPRGVSVSGNRLWVVDRSGRLQIFSLDGKPLLTKTIVEDTKGFPVGILASEEGVIVCDTHNHRIRYFDNSLDETFTFGKYGKSNGHFVYPQRVALGPSQNLFITDLLTTSRLCLALLHDKVWWRWRSESNRRVTDLQSVAEKLQSPTTKELTHIDHSSLASYLASLVEKHPELAAIIDSWPELSNAHRDAIIAMVKAGNTNPRSPQS